MQANEESDCDLYIKKDSAPSIFDYDYVDIQPGAADFIPVVSPGSSRWYIGVYGHSECVYDVSAHEVPSTAMFFIMKNIYYIIRGCVITEG